MSGDLRVTTAHVRELSAKQAAAAAQIGLAATATQGVSAAMWVNHGLICAPSTMAVSAAEDARSHACVGMQSVSTDLEEKLDAAADRYDRVDAQSGRSIDCEMHPR